MTDPLRRMFRSDQFDGFINTGSDRLYKFFFKNFTLIFIYSSAENSVCFNNYITYPAKSQSEISIPALFDNTDAKCYNITIETENDL